MFPTRILTDAQNNNSSNLKDYTLNYDHHVLCYQPQGYYRSLR